MNAFVKAASSRGLNRAETAVTSSSPVDSQPGDGVPQAIAARPDERAGGVFPGAVCLFAALLAGTLASLAACSRVPLVVLPPLVLLLRSKIAARRRSAGEAAQRDAVADLCTALRAEIDAGRLPEQAFTEALRCRPQLRDLAVSAALSAEAPPPGIGDSERIVSGSDSLRAALRDAASSPGREDLAALAACWAAAERHGIAFAEAVRGIEQGLRERIAVRRELTAELAGVRATAALLAVLPLLGLALGSALGSDPLRLLLHDRAGEWCLVIGGGLSMVGLWWTDRITGLVGDESRDGHLPVGRGHGLSRPVRGCGT